MKYHPVDVPPTHATEIVKGIRKSYLVREDKDNPFDIGDNICFLEICCGMVCADHDYFKITSLMKITDILRYYTDNWKEIEDWYIVGFEEMTKEELEKMYKEQEEKYRYYPAYEEKNDKN